MTHTRWTRHEERTMGASEIVKRTTEIVYRWPDGAEEVRYRRTTNSPEALELINEVADLQAKHGADCPYFWREV